MDLAGLSRPSPFHDEFAVGCIIAELITGCPLFLPSSKLDYHVEKAMMFKRVLGPFPLDLARAIADKWPGTFDEDDLDSDYEDGVRPCLQRNNFLSLEVSFSCALE